MTFDHKHRDFDQAFDTLVATWLHADDLRVADAPVGERVRAVIALDRARNAVRAARPV